VEGQDIGQADVLFFISRLRLEGLQSQEALEKAIAEAIGQ
jgi:hypothetical protein